MINIGRGVVVALAGAGLFLIALPLIGLVYRSFKNQAWYNLNTEVIQALILSLITSAVCILFIILMGTPLAYGLARWHFAGRRLVNILIELPIVLPPAVAGLGLLVTFGRRGLFGGVLEALNIQLAFSTYAVIIAQIFVALPFYTRSAQVGFASINPEIEEAALVDGASALGVFAYVTVPLAGRALVSGILLSWARALGEFGATIIFAGSLAGVTRTMPLLIYHMLEYDINAAIWTALILVVLAVFSAGITRFLTVDERNLS